MVVFWAGGIFGSAVIYLPITFAMIAEMQEAVARVVALSAVRANQEAAPLGSLLIVLLRH